MCVICGLPTNHSGLVTLFGPLAIASFVFTSLAGAYLLLLHLRLKKWYRQFAIAGIAYIILGLALTAGQNQLIYLPDDRPFGECKYQDSLVETIETEYVRAYYMPYESEKLLVVYHGNAGNACDRLSYAISGNILGYSVLIIEYPGFADTNQRPSTRQILKNIPFVVELVETLPYTHISLLGESIGSSFASYHATLAPPEQLILISPFARLSDLVQEKVRIYPARWLLFADLKVAEWSASAPRIFIIAAEYDEVIPRHHTERLIASLPSDSTRYQIIMDTTHNSIYGSRHFTEALRQALE